MGVLLFLRLYELASQTGGFCPRRTGRLLGGSTAFFAKESGGKESAERATPSAFPLMRIPAKCPLR